MSKNDALLMVKEASLQELQGVNCKVLSKKEKLAQISYSLSKMTIVDEMEGFENYNLMIMAEFHEFLGRLAHLVFPEQPSLLLKLEKLLQILLPVANQVFVPLDGDNDIESDSDYDDNIVN